MLLRAYIFSTLNLILLSFFYEQYVSEYYSYMGFHSDFDIVRFFIAALTIIVINTFLPTSQSNIAILLGFVFFLVLMPMSILYFNSALSSLTYFIAVMSFFIVFSSSKIKVKVVRLQMFTAKGTLWLLLVAIILFIALLFVRSGFSRLNFNPLDVYAYAV